MKEQHFECFRKIGMVLSTFQKIKQKNGHAAEVRIQWCWSKLKSPQNMQFFLQTDCFDERTKFWIFQENWKGIFHISKNQQKKATPVRSGYSDFGQNWKVRKICCFCFKLIVLMKQHNFEFFRRIGRVFSTFKKSTKKINQKNGHAGKVRIQRFLPKLKCPQKLHFFSSNCLFSSKNNILNVSDNWKGIFNISKNQQKNGHAVYVRIQWFCSK